MKLPQNEKLWLGGGVAVALVLTAGAWFGAISPQLSHASELRNQKVDADNQNQILRHRTNKLRADSAQLPSIVKQLRQDLSKLPVEADLPAYTQQLNRQAASSGVSITAINISDPTPVDANGTPSQAAATTASGRTFSFPMTLTTTGKLADQRAMLNAIQRSGPRASLVHSVKFTPADGAQTIDAASSMTTQLTIYVTPLSPAAALQLQTQLDKTAAS